jgi:hypothetical protein
MTDFFDDLERELRRAHRRDTARGTVSRRLDLWRLPGLRVAGRRMLVALAVVVVALVAVVLAVAREADVERSAAPRPQPNATGDTPPMPTPREQQMDRLRQRAIRNEEPDGLRAVQVADRWAQLFASGGVITMYMSQPAGERVRCVDVIGRPIKGCTPPSAEFRKSFQRASVERIVIRGRKASATFTNGEVVELSRAGRGWDIWMITKIGENAGRGFGARRAAP